MEQAPPPANCPEQRPGREAVASADLTRARTAALFSDALRQSAHAKSELLELEATESFLARLSSAPGKAPAQAVAAALDRVQATVPGNSSKRPWLQVLGVRFPRLSWGWTSGAALSAMAVLVLVIGAVQTAPPQPGVPLKSEAARPVGVAPAAPAAPAPLPVPRLDLPAQAGPPLIAAPPVLAAPPAVIAPEAAVKNSGAEFPALDAVPRPLSPPQTADRCRDNDRVQTAEAENQRDRKAAPDCPSIAASRPVDVPLAGSVPPVAGIPSIPPAPPPVFARPAISLPPPAIPQR